MGESERVLTAALVITAEGLPIVRLPEGAPEEHLEFVREWYRATMEAIEIRKKYPSMTKAASGPAKVAKVRIPLPGTGKALTIVKGRQTDAVGGKACKATTETIQ